jgi:hypothetical protein
LFSAQFALISAPHCQLMFELPKENPMRRTTNETLISAVRGGLIAGMDTPVLPSNTHGQFAFGRGA